MRTPVKNSQVHHQVNREMQANDNQVELISVSEKEGLGGPNGHFTESIDELTNNKTPLREDNIDLVIRDDK